MSRFKQLYTLAFALILSAPTTLLAQGDAMTELYGVGVHLYFCGDNEGADLMLSQVVDSGSLDPRAHYFRGLVRERMGSGGGDMDFEQGARLEAEGKRVVAVGHALTRIQGSMRTKIEKARRTARVQHRTQQILAEEARRKLIPQPTVPAEAAPAPPTEATDPFGADGGIKSGEAAVDPVAPEVGNSDANTNPFGDEPAPPANPATPETTAPASDLGNPFGDPPASDGANPFGSEPAAGGDGNPFGL